VTYLIFGALLGRGWVAMPFCRIRFKNVGRSRYDYRTDCAVALLATYFVQEMFSQPRAQ
jgi:hypothetical protein